MVAGQKSKKAKENKHGAVIPYHGEIGYQGELKISKTDVTVWLLDRDQRKIKKTNMAQ